MLKSLFHWKVLLNIILAIAVFLGLVWLTFRWLEFHTNHGRELEVPNVINMSMQDAVRVLDDAGLEYEVDSFKFDPKYKPFQVLQIYPAPGSRVKDGRAITMRVNPRTWAKVAVPDVLDRYKYLAFRQLDLVGLKVGDTLYEPSIAKDAVLRLMFNGTPLKPGTLLPKFSVIDVVIGQGPRRNVAVPNLIGMTVQQAKAIIKQNYFELGLIDYENGSGDQSQIVYYQVPAGGSLSDQGLQIDLWASAKTPAEMHSRIDELDAVYRRNLRAEPVPSFPDVDFDEPTPAPRTQPTPAPRQETPKPAETKPQTKPQPTTPATQQPKEKPKEKKV
ncbi:MAG: PASTA domain-containing protein, partial [Chryseobacterium sp.]